MADLRKLESKTSVETNRDSELVSEPTAGLNRVQTPKTCDNYFSSLNHSIMMIHEMMRHLQLQAVCPYLR
jgi:hypothetical protein